MRGRLFAAIALLLTLALAAMAVLSLSWRVTVDAPIMLYMGLLVEQRHAVPYRDFFDMNLPGSYWLYGILGRVSGESDLGLRILDLAYLGALSCTTLVWMRRIAWQSAWAGAVLFGFAYLDGGPLLSLQREYFLLLPISAAAVLAGTERWDVRLRALGVGLLFGLTSTVKPQAGLVGLPVLAVFLGVVDGSLARGHVSARDWLARAVAPAALGAALPTLCVLFYLWHAGALADFVTVARGYLPLYARLDGYGEARAGAARAAYLVRGFLFFGGNLAWFVPAALGVFVALYHSELATAARRQVGLLVGLAFAYSVYPLFSGQFWGYHWLPFVYLLVLASSLCLVQPATTSSFGRALPPLALLFACVLMLRPPDAIRLQVQGLPPRPPDGGRADEIAAYLESHLLPGDTVQPLDWTGGAVHAMLIARAQLATPFLYDFHFYHHVSSPFIQGLRARFMAALRTAPPRFVLRLEARPWPSGPDTTREFPELEEFLAQHYAVSARGDGYQILERTDAASPS
ncbi:MAG TPA: hypothetical protein VMR31_19100 [Myxococcota bacterium]|nr:hypothetical protein [Myxococcota bacterium]